MLSSMVKYLGGYKLASDDFIAIAKQIVVLCKSAKLIQKECSTIKLIYSLPLSYGFRKNGLNNHANRMQTNLTAFALHDNSNRFAKYET